jgi:hypothetical protein
MQPKKKQRGCGYALVLQGSVAMDQHRSTDGGAGAVDFGGPAVRSRTAGRRACGAGGEE